MHAISIDENGDNDDRNDKNDKIIRNHISNHYTYEYDVYDTNNYVNYNNGNGYIDLVITIMIITI